MGSRLFRLCLNRWARLFQPQLQLDPPLAESNKALVDLLFVESRLVHQLDIKGFLHWGYNFWFTQYSLDVVNPYVDTTAGGAFPSGDSFVVYPLDKAGEVVCSLRLYVFNDGLQDMRAMQLLEQLAGREKVLELLEEIQGFAVYPRKSQYILDTREKVNQMIREFV